MFSSSTPPIRSFHKHDLWSAGSLVESNLPSAPWPTHPRSGSFPTAPSTDFPGAPPQPRSPPQRSQHRRSRSPTYRLDPRCRRCRIGIRGRIVFQSRSDRKRLLQRARPPASHRPRRHHPVRNESTALDSLPSDHCASILALRNSTPACGVA